MGCALRFAAPAVVLVVLAGTTSASAESRLFSVKAAEPGVTIDQALVDGKSLPISGKGGGVTFFRLDSPGDVPCTQHVTFVASTGARQDADVPLCPQNWNFTIQLAAANPAPQPAAPPEPAKPAPSLAPPAPAAGGAPAATMPSGLQIVTIATDDPQVGIDAVFLEKQPAKIVNHQGNGVQIEVPGGGPCQRDLGLTLSDGRTIARPANFCEHNGSVLVMLGSGSDVAGSQPTPPQPPQPPQPGPPPEPAVGATGDRVWSFVPGQGNVTLVYGAPQSDDSEFLATCAPASGQAHLELMRPVAGLQENAPVAVTLNAGAFSQAYNAKGSPFSEMDGASHPELTLPASDPLWQSLIRESMFVIGVQGQEPYVLSLKGSAAAVKQFLSACAVPVAAPPVPPVPVGAPPGGGRVVNYSCNDGSSVQISFLGPGSAVVRDPGAAPISLSRAPSPAGTGHYVNPPADLFGAGESVRWSRFGEPARRCFPR